MISVEDKLNDLHDWISRLDSSLNENEMNVKNLNDRLSLIESKIKLGNDSEKNISLEKSYENIIDNKNKEIDELKSQVSKMMNLISKYAEVNKILNDFEF